MSAILETGDLSHNILELVDVLTTFFFATTAIERDYL